MPSPSPTRTSDRPHPRASRPNGLHLPSDRALLAIQTLHDAFDPFDLLVALYRATQAFGARASACVHVVPDPERATQVLLLLACDPHTAWAYRPMGTWLQHPWLQHAREHTEAVLASTLDGPPMAGAQDEPAIEHPPDLSSMLIVPTHSGGGTGRFSALVLDTTHLPGVQPIAPEARKLLAHSLASELHEWWLRRTRSELQHRARLRSDDLSMLAFERQGLSTKQIAREKGIGVTAVDSRFQRINAKLGVTSRRNAALRAAIHGLL